MPLLKHSVHDCWYLPVTVIKMTIFSGVVAILSPTLMSRLPTYASDKTKGPCALGTVLERMQTECGVACTRTAENVCMVQGEWEAIRRAHSYLNHHDALNKVCKPSAEPLTKKARRDRSPEPEAGVVPATVTSAPNTPVSISSTAGRVKGGRSLLQKIRSSSPTEGSGVPLAALAVIKSELACTTSRKTVPQPPPLHPAPLSLISTTTKTTPCTTPKHTSSPTPSQGRSGAGKRKQGIPRKQVQNLSVGAADDSASDNDDDCYQDLSLSAPNIAQDSPAFANGDSSIQIVAAWGNFKEENISEMPHAPKTELPSDDDNRSGFYDSDKEATSIKSRMPGTGVYTVQSDGHGGTVILPSVAEPVYVLNVTSTGDVDLSGNESMYGYSSENIYHSSPEKSSNSSGGTTKWTLNKKSSNGKIGGASTARKSTTPRISARKSTTQRTILLVTKKAAAQASQKAGKKAQKVSPQRRRGIIQGDSPVKGEYTCSYCQKIFNTKEAIQVHEEVYHTGRYKSMPSSSKSPLFECTQCGKSYMSKHALEEHLYTHVGMRPFACPYCAASFNHRKSLRRHVQLHNNVKRFDCPQCSKTFVRKDALESHLRIHKAEEEASGSDVNVDVTTGAD